TRYEVTGEADGVRPQSEYNNRRKGRDKNLDFNVPQIKNYGVKGFRDATYLAWFQYLRRRLIVLNLLDDGGDDRPRAGLGLNKPFELQPQVLFQECRIRKLRAGRL